MAKKKAKPKAPKVSRIIYLRDNAYKGLRKTVEWYESTPGPVELDDNAHDQVADCMCSYLLSHIQPGEGFSECFIMRGRMYLNILVEDPDGIGHTLEEQRVLILPRSKRPQVKKTKFYSKRKDPKEKTLVVS